MYALVQMFVVFIVGTKSYPLTLCQGTRPFYTATEESNAVAVIGHCCWLRRSQMTLTKHPSGHEQKENGWEELAQEFSIRSRVV